jgi:hypothetical protein
MFKVNKKGKLVCEECGKEALLVIDGKECNIYPSGDHKIIIINSTYKCDCGYEHEVHLELDTDDVL